MAVILCDIGDEAEIIAEERQNWLSRVLVAFGMDEDMAARDTFESKQSLMMLGLDVWRGSNGTIRIFRPEYATFEVPDEQEGSVREVDVERNQKVVAEWHPPEIVRIREALGKEHYRITLKEWALPLQTGGES